MEIERKFLIDSKQIDYKKYPCKSLEQGYLSVNPVVRVRKEDDEYFLTYKSGGMMAREEYNLPLTPESYSHLILKADGIIISKTRYLIPLDKYTVELDEFHGDLSPLLMAEVEFPTIEEAVSFTPPEWFGKEVTNDPEYHNSNMSRKPH